MSRAERYLAAVPPSFVTTCPLSPAGCMLTAGAGRCHRAHVLLPTDRVRHVGDGGMIPATPPTIGRVPYDARQMKWRPHIDHALARCDGLTRAIVMTHGWIRHGRWREHAENGRLAAGRVEAHVAKFGGGDRFRQSRQPRLGVAVRILHGRLYRHLRLRSAAALRALPLRQG